MLRSITRIYFYILLFLNFLAIGFFFMSTNRDFFANLDMERSLEGPALSAAHGLFLVYAGGVILRVISSTENQEKIFFLIFGLMLAFLPFILALLFSITSPKGMLYFSNRESGVNFQKSYLISNKAIAKQRSGSCYNSILNKDEEDRSFLQLTRCVSYDDFERLKVGDIVLVTGQRSIFGVDVYSYKY